MDQPWNRREVLKGLAAVSASLCLRPGRGTADALSASGSATEIQITPVDEHSLRLTILKPDSQGQIPSNGSLVKESWGGPTRTVAEESAQPISAGNFRLTISWHPISITVADEHGQPVQELGYSEDSGVLTFSTGTSPLLGLGEGGPQFDRRGSTDSMRSGQGGYKLSTHGGRVPIPWVIGTAGWAIFFHQPSGTFDFSGSRSKFIPSARESALPLDLFLVVSSNPATIMAEYARLTGYPEMPPLWSFGYQQSHRTLGSRDEIIAEAKTFREKKLPCDAMIYLGTGFCPSGWNTENGSFDWNSRVFPDPQRVLAELHEQHFRAVVHVVILSDQLRGTVHDKCELSRYDAA